MTVFLPKGDRISEQGGARSPGLLLPQQGKLRSQRFKRISEQTQAPTGKYPLCIFVTNLMSPVCSSFKHFIFYFYYFFFIEIKSLYK